MPVKHNLYADLGVTAEQFEAHKKAHSQLADLEAKYLSKDRDVVDAEESRSADDLVNKLRMERLAIKDKIEAMLKLKRT